MSKIKSLLFEAVDDIYETIPSEVSLKDDYYGMRYMRVAQLPPKDLEDVVDYAIAVYITKLGDVKHQEFLEESKRYLRELIIEQILD